MVETPADPRPELVAQAEVDECVAKMRREFAAALDHPDAYLRAAAWSLLVNLVDHAAGASELPPPYARCSECACPLLLLAPPPPNETTKRETHGQ